MSKVYPTTPGNEGYAKNMECIGYHDLNNMPAFQFGIWKTEEGKYYLYSSCYKHNYYHVLDVTDPTNPVMVNSFPAPNVSEEQAPNTIVMKVQVADGKMIGVTCGGIPFLHGGTVNGLRDAKNSPVYTSLQIFDIATDPVHPKLIGEWKENRVHRFCYEGGRYVHLSAEAEGFNRMIYRIIDIEDPQNIKEAGRWWLPNQWIAGQVEKPTWDPTSGIPERERCFGCGSELMDWEGMHGPAYVVDDKAYIGWMGGGLVILDISNIKVPKLIGQLKFHPGLFGGDLSGARCHTALPLSPRPYVVATNEGERFFPFDKDIIGGRAQPMNNLHMIDVHDPSRPTLIAEFPYPEVPEDFPFPNYNDMGLGCPGPFGPHNLHEPMGKPGLEDDPNRVYCCYFHAGMRVYDVSDPFVPKEIAYFIPPNPTKKYEVNTPGPLLGMAEDCVVDDRGNIFMVSSHDGMYVLRCTV